MPCTRYSTVFTSSLFSRSSSPSSSRSAYLPRKGWLSGQGRECAHARQAHLMPQISSTRRTNWGRGTVGCTAMPSARACRFWPPKDDRPTCSRLLSDNAHAVVVAFSEVAPLLERLGYEGPLRVMVALGLPPDGRTALGAHAPPWPRDRWPGAQSAKEREAAQLNYILYVSPEPALVS